METEESKELSEVEKKNKEEEELNKWPRFMLSLFYTTEIH